MPEASPKGIQKVTITDFNGDAIAGGTGGGPASIADGLDVAQGSTADVAWVAGAGTVISLLKKIASAGGSAVSIADGADVAQGTTTDASSASTVIGLLKNLKAALAGTLTVGLPSGASTAAKQPVIGTAGASSVDVISVQGIASGTAQPVSGPVTDTQLRATPVPVSGTVTASGPVTDTQLRATPVPVSGTVTATPTGTQAVSHAVATQADGHSANIGLLADAASASTLTGLLKNIKAALAGTLAVSGTFWQATQPVSGTVTASGPVTDTQLRATPVPVSGTVTATPTGTQAVSHAVATQADGHSANIGLLADAASASTLTGLLKNIKAALAGSLAVTGTFWQATQPVSGTVTTTPPANASTNVAQINGVTPLMGSGNTGTGSPRVTLATDQPNLTTPLNVSLAANQSVNAAQINGVTPLMGAGISGTGAQRVTPSIAATGAAPTAFTSTTSAQIFASNANRRLFTVYNNSDKDLFLMFAAAAASATSYHVIVKAAGGFFSTTDYSGEIRGIMAAAITTGQVNPAEFT